MRFGQRLKIVIEKYFSSQRDLADKLNIDQGNLNRYLNGKVQPGLDFLSKLYENGISINWLLSGEGFPLNVEHETIRNKRDLLEKPIDRIRKWIISNYNSFESFCACTNMNYHDLQDYLDASIQTDLDFVELLNKSGCNIFWIASGTGPEWANNPNGEILKMKKFGLLKSIDEINIDLTELLNKEEYEQLSKQALVKILTNTILKIKAEDDEDE